MKLEEQVSTLSSAKSTLETRVAESETKVNETERLLHATEDMLKLLNEDLEQKRELETTTKGAIGSSEEKALLEGKLADLQEKNAQMSEQIVELTEKVQSLEEEKEGLCNKMDSMDKTILELEDLLAEKEDVLAETEVELLAKKRLEREIKGLKIELGKEQTEMERLKAEIEELTRISQAANGKILDLEEDRAELEARTAALLEDKKRAGVKASELGNEILKLETEHKELNLRFSDMNTKYCNIVAERDELLQTNRTLLRNK